MSRTVRSVLIAGAAALVLAAPACAQQASRPDDARFVASSRGTVYYWIGCEAAERVSRRNRRYFRTSEEAEAAGYRPSGARGCAPQRDAARIRARSGGSAVCTVERIADGDTFTCSDGTRVRLLLVDTPELADAPHGAQARAFTASLLPPGTDVRLEFDVDPYDRYGRVLAYVYRDGMLVNREIVRRGVGAVVVFQPNVRLLEVMRAAADSARREGLTRWRER